MPGESYEVYYRRKGENSWTAAESVVGNSTILNGLTSGTTYEIRVLASDGTELILRGLTTSATPTPAPTFTPKPQVDAVITPVPTPLVAGGIVEMGSWQGQALRWDVLQVEGSDMALLVTHDIIDYQPFSAAAENATWADSSIRAWLNDIFLSGAFSK